MSCQSTWRQVLAGAKMTAVAGVVGFGLAFAPAPAAAVTFGGSLYTGDPNNPTPDPIDLLDVTQVPGTFTADFLNSPGGADTWTFNFLNSSGSLMVLSLITATLNQQGTSYYWENGATTTFGANVPVVTAQGDEESFNLDSLVAPGDTVSLVFSFGDAVLALSGAGPTFDFGVSASVVPLPAALVLFLSGLAGIGVLGRYNAKRRRETEVV